LQRQLLQMDISDPGHGSSTSSKGAKHRSSLFTVFSPASGQPGGVTESPNASKRRMFRSELNLSSLSTVRGDIYEPPSRINLSPLSAGGGGGGGGGGRDMENTYRSFDEDELENILHPLPEAIAQDLSDDNQVSQEVLDRSGDSVVEEEPDDVGAVQDVIISSSVSSLTRSHRVRVNTDANKTTPSGNSCVTWDAYRIVPSRQQPPSLASSTTSSPSTGVFTNGTASNYQFGLKRFDNTEQLNAVGTNGDTGERHDRFDAARPASSGKSSLTSSVSSCGQLSYHNQDLENGTTPRLSRKSSSRRLRRPPPTLTLQTPSPPPQIEPVPRESKVCI